MNSDTAAYYDANTRRFLRFGLGSASGSIHRAVWAPGVSTRREAMNYVDGLVLEDIRRVSSTREPGTRAAGAEPVVVDLGCGVGGTVAYLEKHLPAAYLGITNSRVQQQLASDRARERGSPATFRVDDHGDPELYRSRLPGRGVDLLYMIESFVHAADPRTVVDGVARALRPGGRFVLCDDVLASPEARSARSVCAFRRGWHVHSLLTVDELAAMAAAAGLRLVSNQDFTGYVELRRPRDRVIGLIAPLIPRLGLRTPFWDNMYGGDALQRALLAGLIQYRYLVFEA
jgi:SAM-dependent methyltransferase